MAKIGESNEGTLEAAKRIIAGFGITEVSKYNGEAHAAMILAGLKELLMDEEKLELTAGSKLRIMRFLQAYGICWNSNQFKQKIFGKPGSGAAVKEEEDILAKYKGL